MGTVLNPQWLAGADRIAVVDEASPSEVREAVRARGRGRLPDQPLEKLVAAASELARNQLTHAATGVIGLRDIEREGVPGLEVIAADRGPGIADPTAALRGAPRATGSLGVGLSAVTRQADELDFDLRHGAGTCVRIRSFASPVRRSEVGIIGRPHPAERVIGDQALAVRDASRLLVGVVDGLGHGPLAREAADRAVTEVLAHPDTGLADQLAAIHRALGTTRGAVMSLVRIELADQALEHAGVGNITTRVIARDGVARPLTTTAGTLGSAFPRKVHVERTTYAPGELLVMYSDGLQSRVDLTHDPALLRAHPISIAQDLLARFGRDHDDALVIVVR